MVIPGIRGMSLREFFRQLYREMSDDAISDSAATLSFYFIFALFPFVFFLVALTPYLPIRGTLEGALDRARALMPSEAMDVLQGHITRLTTQTRPKLLTFGLFASIWSASRGVDAIRKALNLAYRVPESRPFWKTQALALLVTIAGVVLLVIASLAFALGGDLGHWVAVKVGLGEEVHELWAWLRWPFTVLSVMLSAALSYWLLPDVKQEFKFITPGSVIGSFSWVGATWGFTQYAQHFGRYDVTYGSIGGVVLLLMWLYISGTILVVGGEINAIIEHASAEGKREGARAPGEAPAVAIDGQPAPLTPGAVKRAGAARRLRWRLWRRRRTQPA